MDDVKRVFMCEREYVNINWFKELFIYRFIYIYIVIFLGGGENFVMYVFIGFYDDRGWILVDYVKRIMVNIKNFFYWNEDKIKVIIFV